MTVLPADPQRSFGFLLHDIARLLRADFARRVRAHGLTQAQWRLLAHLARQEGVNQATLADVLDVQPITLARLVDRMAADGWVERRPDPADRRAFRLYLTGRAQPILGELWRHAGAAIETAMSGLPPPEREQLIETLLHVKRNLEDAGRAAPDAGGKNDHVA
ncbi:MAG: MarR family winged helix-turn-helix transcriptional regulator [Rhodospirillales bacterium]